MKEKPRSLEVNKLPGKVGYHLLLGQEHIWFDQSPQKLADELKDWVTFFFERIQARA